MSAEDEAELLAKTYRAIEIPESIHFFCLESSGFPKIFGDHDVFCHDAVAVRKFLLKELREKLPKDWSISSKRRGKTHFHLDVNTAEGKFIHKIDIYGRSALSPIFFEEKVFGELAKAQNPNLERGSLKLSNVQEATIRFYTYVSSFWTGRDKVHHLEWILGDLSEDERLSFHEHCQKIALEIKAPRAKVSFFHAIAALLVFYSPSRFMSFLVDKKTKFSRRK